MTLTIEQFQKDAKPWLAKLKETGEPLVLLSDDPVQISSVRDSLGHRIGCAQQEKQADTVLEMC